MTVRPISLLGVIDPGGTIWCRCVTGNCYGRSVVDCRFGCLLLGMIVASAAYGSGFLVAAIISGAS